MLILGKISRFSLFTLSVPYFIVRRAFFLSCLKRADLWVKSPFKYLFSPVKLPDGNLVFWSWEEDAFWLRDMIKEIYEDHAYEHFFGAEKGEVVIDVGANIGIFTLKSSKKVGEKGKVVAFEPKKRNYDLLSRNIRINKCQNVLPLNIAVSDSNCNGTLYVKSVSLHNTLLEQTDFETDTIKTETVKVRKLSSVLKNLNIKHVDFLKIDAEGCELSVLKGLEEFLLRKQIKKISVAAYHSAKQLDIISEYLNKWGYFVLNLQSNGLAGFQRTHVFAVSQQAHLSV